MCVDLIGLYNCRLRYYGSVSGAPSRSLIVPSNRNRRVRALRKPGTQPPLLRQFIHISSILWLPSTLAKSTVWVKGIALRRPAPQKTRPTYRRVGDLALTYGLIPHIDHGQSRTSGASVASISVKELRRRGGLKSESRSWMCRKGRGTA